MHIADLRRRAVERARRRLAELAASAGPTRQCRALDPRVLEETVKSLDDQREAARHAGDAAGSVAATMAKARVLGLSDGGAPGAA